MAPTSKGVLIYAFNTNFDYVSAAKFAAKQVKKFLNLPVALVTDTPIDDPLFDHVIVLAKDEAETSSRVYKQHTGEMITVEWLNRNRVSAYELSPFDRTLLIDADYFMFNNSLRAIFDTDTEIACFDKIVDIAGQEEDLIRLHSMSIPMLWATVVYFKKCPTAEGVFAFMDIIKQNWDYYGLLYRFKSGPYRNDFSLSIAMDALCGYTTDIPTLPGKLHTMFTHVDVRKVTDGEVVYTWNGKSNKIVNTNIHCMNKMVLQKFYES